MIFLSNLSLSLMVNPIVTSPEQSNSASNGVMSGGDGELLDLQRTKKTGIQRGMCRELVIEPSNMFMVTWMMNWWD